MAVRELVENSFPGDEPILIRDAGKIRMARIGEVVESKLGPGSIEFENRHYRHLEEPLEVLTLDENLNLAFRRVTAVFKHPSPTKLWRISLQSGREVRTTSVHNVFVLSDDLQVIGKETRSLKRKDRVVVPEGPYMPGSLDHIDLLEELLGLGKKEQSNLVVRGAVGLYPVAAPRMELLIGNLEGKTLSRPMLHDAAHRLGFSKPDNHIHALRRKGVLANSGRGKYFVAESRKFRRSYTISKDWIRCDAVPLPFLAANLPPKLEQASIRFSVKQGRGSLPRILPITPELMRILGYYTSKGSVHAGYKVSFSFGSHERSTYVEDLIMCLRKVFGVEPTVSVEHGSAVNVVINDSMMGLFLESILGAGSDSSDKRVPWVVLNVGKELAEEYLTAYIRGDGCVETAKGRRRIIIVTSSVGLFTDLKFLLMLLGRCYSTSYRGPSKRVVNGVPTGFAGAHYIYIRMAEAPEAGSIPIGRYRRELLASSQGKTNAYNERVEKKWIRENFAPEVLPEAVRRVAYSAAGALAVRSVEQVDSDEKWLYDIAVEGVERFVGGGAVALLHNSMDAAELAGVPPEIYVRMTSENTNPEIPDPKPYRLVVIDNGPGVAPQHVPSAFGKVFYGSKYVLRQSRGMFGLGGTMAMLYGQITTNRPFTIITCPDGKRKYGFQMMIDITENRPMVLKRFNSDANGTTGTRVEMVLEGDYLRASQKIGDYFKQTALVASYANLTFVDPLGQVTFYERGTSSMPASPKETLPHPYGVDVEAFKRIVKLSEEHDMKSFMVTHFHRVGDKIATKFLEFAGISPRLPPKRLNTNQIVAIVDALQRFPDFLQPDAAVLSPVGEDILLAGINKELQPEFATVVDRPPSSYSGFPFLVEVGVAYGGKILQPGVKLFRFANRIPLLYDESSDVSFEVLNEEVDWRRYHVPPEAPVGVITHIASTRIPYKTVGKEYIADRPEIQREIRNAAREALRRLGIFLSKKGSMEAVQRKMNIYGKYLPLIARFSTELAGKKREPNYQTLIKEEGNASHEEAPAEEQPEEPREGEIANQEEGGQETIDKYGGS